MSDNDFKHIAHEIEVSFTSSHPIVHSFEIIENSKQDEIIYQEDKITFYQAVLDVIKIFIPSSLAYMVELGILFTNIIFISLLNDPVLLSGGGLGFTTVNLVVFSIDTGLCGGIDTLVSQAFGRKDYYLGGVYLNSSRVILIILTVFQVLLLVNCETIFVLLDQPPEASAIAQIYILSVLPGVFLNAQFEGVRRFLLVQKISYPILWVISCSLGVHIIFLYIYIVILDLAITGIAIATATTYLLNFVFITSYVHFKKDLIPRESWHGFDLNCILKIPNYLRYGLPSCIMLLAEWWAFEGVLLMVGWLGVIELAATVIMYNYGLLMLMLPIGIAYSSSSLVGNSLGGNRPKMAQAYSQSIIIFGWGVIFCLVGSTIIFKDYIFRMYTSDNDVLDQIMFAFPIWIIKLITDMTQVMMGGILRSMGYQVIATVTGILSYWGIMMPGAYIFCFLLDFKLRGIWIGIVLGTFTQAISFLYLIIKAPWKEIAFVASQHNPINKILENINEEENSEK